MPHLSFIPIIQLIIVTTIIAEVFMRTRSLIAGITLLFFSACTMYPLGISEAEWNSMTPQQQLEARNKQADINLKKQQEKERKEAQRKAEIQKRYQQAAFGDILNCSVSGGIADFYPGWRPYAPQAFSIVRGEDKNITLYDNNKGRRTTSFWTEYAESGMKLTFCKDKGARRDKCQEIVGTTPSFTGGITQTLQLSRIMKDVTLTCHPGNVRPTAAGATTVIIYNNGQAQPEQNY